MDSIIPGQLVNQTEDSRHRDGIVFDIPSASKVVVAVVDRSRGPLFRTVHPRTLTERVEDGADDPALRRLLRRTPTPAHGGARSEAGTGRGRPGYARAAMHCPTAK